MFLKLGTLAIIDDLVLRASTPTTIDDLVLRAGTPMIIDDLVFRLRTPPSACDRTLAQIFFGVQITDPLGPPSAPFSIPIASAFTFNKGEPEQHCPPIYPLQSHKIQLEPF